MQVFAACHLQAQDAELDETDVQATVKANYLFNFAKYSDWPSEAKQGAFVICVVGSDAVYDELKSKYRNKPIGSQLLEVRPLKADGLSEGRVHVLYIGASAAKEMPALIRAYKKSPTLIVTELDSGLDAGAFINFRSVESVVRFEINDTKARLAGISIGDRLKGWAVNIK